MTAKGTAPTKSTVDKTPPAPAEEEYYDPFGPDATADDLRVRLELLEDHCYGKGVRPAFPDSEED